VDCYDACKNQLKVVQRSKVLNKVFGVKVRVWGTVANSPRKRGDMVEIDGGTEKKSAEGSRLGKKKDVPLRQKRRKKKNVENKNGGSGGLQQKNQRRKCNKRTNIWGGSGGIDVVYYESEKVDA